MLTNKLYLEEAANRCHIQTIFIGVSLNLDTIHGTEKVINQVCRTVKKKYYLKTNYSCMYYFFVQIMIKPGRTFSRLNPPI